MKGTSVAQWLGTCLEVGDPRFKTHCDLLV